MDIKHLRLLLYRSFDEPLSLSEKQLLEAGLVNFPALQEEKKQLLKMRQLLSEVKVEQSPQFVNKVLIQLDSAHQEMIIVKLFPRVAAACVIFFAITFLGLYLGDWGLSSEILVGVDEVSIEDAYAFLEE